jgi:hypothetical protein
MTAASDTTAMLLKYPPPSRERYGDANEDVPVASSPSSPPKALEAAGTTYALRAFTPGQAIALLTMRRSDWSKAVLAHLRAFGRDTCSGDDFRTLAKMGFAISKGSYHVLTPSGRWKADIVAMDLARAEGMHAITYDLGNLHKAAAVKCTCGHVIYKSRHLPNWMIALSRAGRAHLESVGEFVASEAAE